MKYLIFYTITFFIFFKWGVVYTQTWPIIYGDNIVAFNRCMIEDYDHGILLSGNTGNSQVQAKMAWLLKIDVNGNILWEKSYGGVDYYSYFNIVRKVSNEGCLLAGSTSKYDNENKFDPLFMKIDPCGEIEWCTTIHDETISWNNYGTGIIELADGSSVGMVKYYGNKDQGFRISLVKLDPNGEPVWVQHLAQEDSTVFNEEGYDLILTSDSNYLVAGHRNTPRPYFIKCDSMGKEEWALTWNQADIAWGSVAEVIEKDSGIFYAIGGGVSPGYTVNPLLFKLDKYGNGLYHKVILGDTIKGGDGGSLEILNDSTLVVGYNWGTDPNPNEGFSGVATTDTLGNIINRRFLAEDTRPPSSIIKTFDGKIVVVGHYYLDGNWDVYLWKMNSLLEDDSIYTQTMVYDSLCPEGIVSDTIDLNCGLYVDIGEIPTREEYENPLKVYPNPATGHVHISTKVGGQEKVVEIFNPFGRQVSSNIIPATGELDLDVSAWPQGLYLFSLVDHNRLVGSVKVVVQ